MANTTVTLAGPLAGTWEVDEAQRDAAWAMYVELVTRVAIQKRAADEGLLREGLSSLHALFLETRRILKEHGPAVARPTTTQTLSFGMIAMEVLNHWLRPVLTHFHPRLLDHECHRGDTPPREHELAWSEAGALRSELDALQDKLIQYADWLADACAVPPLHRPMT